MGSIFQKPPNNYQYYVGQNNLVNYRFDVVNQTAPVTNAILQDNLVIPANTFVQDGQKCIIWMFGNIGAHAGSAVSFTVQNNGITSLFTANSPANASGHGCEILLEITRINGANNQALMFGTLFTNHGIGAVAQPLIVAGSRNFLNPFGNGFNADNTLRLLCTDGAGAEVISHEVTYITIQ